MSPIISPELWSRVFVLLAETSGGSDEEYSASRVSLAAALRVCKVCYMSFAQDTRLPDRLGILSCRRTSPLSSSSSSESFLVASRRYQFLPVRAFERHRASHDRQYKASPLAPHGASSPRQRSLSTAGRCGISEFDRTSITGYVCGGPKCSHRGHHPANGPNR